jgi:CRP/FNR family transcriptional regulator
MTAPSLITIAETSSFDIKPRRMSLDRDQGHTRNTLRFAPHEHLFFQGDAPRGIYEILSGTVIQYKVMADGRRQIQSFASEGDFLAMTFSDQHDLSAEALTDVEVLFVPRSVFDHRLQEQPKFRQSVLTLISQLLQDAREQALLLGRKNAMERTASFLIFLNDRFCDPATGFAPIRMSRCDIADYLGLTLETVSRMMNKLKKHGVIALPQPNTFRVLNRSRLVALAGEIEDEAYLAP